MINKHVVILNNYLRPHHVASYLELAKRVRQLTVLLSVEMEPDREFDAEWNELDVRIQKNWMFTTKWKHSTGFSESNFIHVPVDTTRQLKEISADIVFSYEMGMRTLLAGRYCRRHPNVPLVMVGNMSEDIEKERGMLRRSLRKIICRHADYFTYNGPSCRRYLKSLGLSDERLFLLPYCIDEEKISRTVRTPGQADTRRLLYCGSISERKGILRFAKRLQAWCQSNAQLKVILNIAGNGDQKSQVEECSGDRLQINFLGNCGPEELRNAYSSNDICVFPTLADEWGLVPVEALASGVPVLGSTLAQSVETVVMPGRNGWVFDPSNPETITDAISEAMSCSIDKLKAMEMNCKDSVSHISPQETAESFCRVISAAFNQ